MRNFVAAMLNYVQYTNILTLGLVLNTPILNFAEMLPAFDEGGGGGEFPPFGLKKAGDFKNKKEDPILDGNIPFAPKDNHL